jgi:hypothetical protein
MMSRYVQKGLNSLGRSLTREKCAVFDEFRELEFGETFMSLDGRAGFVVKIANLIHP